MFYGRKLDLDVQIDEQKTEAHVVMALHCRADMDSSCIGACYCHIIATQETACTAPNAKSGALPVHLQTVIVQRKSLFHAVLLGWAQRIREGSESRLKVGDSYHGLMSLGLGIMVAGPLAVWKITPRDLDELFRNNHHSQNPDDLL